MNTIFATFPNTELASEAVGALLDHGVAREDISVIVREIPTADSDTPNDVLHQAESGITVTTAGDAAKGAAKGAGYGLGIGAIAAIASVAIPGFGLVLGGGALAAAAAGALGSTAAGAIAGAVTGYLADQGVDSAEAEKSAQLVEAGGAIVGVANMNADIPASDITGILHKYNGAVHAARVLS